LESRPGLRSPLSGALSRGERFLEKAFHAGSKGRDHLFVDQEGWFLAPLRYLLNDAPQALRLVAVASVE
jgi:hypothetical protein